MKPRKDLEIEGVIHSFLSFDSQILLSIIMPDRLLTEETFNFPGLRGEGRARRDACLRYDVGRRRHVGGCGGFAHRFPQSLWLPCLRKLMKINPTHLVLLGDVFDFVEGKPKASHVVSFPRLLKNLNVHMRCVLGCSNSNVPGFLKPYQGLRSRKTRGIPVMRFKIQY